MKLADTLLCFASEIFEIIIKLLAILWALASSVGTTQSELLSFELWIFGSHDIYMQNLSFFSYEELMKDIKFSDFALYSSIYWRYWE